ncbi:cephalosporin hydroxylase, partial [Candidatus Beckwithbacteria bacterium RBG_13_42_9]
AAFEWMKVVANNKLSYEIDWLGIPIIQTPTDLVLMQELIFKVKPDVIIEIGIAHGGSLVFYASLLELLGKGKVVGIDVEIREHNRKVLEKHPLFKRIALIEGNSLSRKVFAKAETLIPRQAKILVCLDSDHTKAHVLKELQLYQKFIKPGGYIIVFDTIASALAKFNSSDKKYLDNGPAEAVREFLKKNKSFVIDKKCDKLFISTSPNGYLKRIK